MKIISVGSWADTIGPYAEDPDDPAREKTRQ